MWDSPSEVNQVIKWWICIMIIYTMTIVVSFDFYTIFLYLPLLSVPVIHYPLVVYIYSIVDMVM